MEELVKIVDRKDQVLCTKMIPIIKVLWRNHGVEEALWEVESLPAFVRIAVYDSFF